MQFLAFLFTNKVRYCQQHINKCETSRLMKNLAIAVWFIAASASIIAAGTWLGHTIQTMDQTITSSTLNQHTTG